VDIETVTDELYSLHPNEFTAVRNERAKQAQAEGDKEVAEQIRHLEKPTTSAWLVNLLAREHSEELEPLIDLGRDLREAAADIGADELRQLTRQRHQVVYALVQQARRLGAAQGTKVSDAVATEVQQTLDASLADPEVADVVLAGRLTHPQEYAGFGGPMGGAPGRTGARPSARTAPKPPARRDGKDKQADVADLAARRRESAQRALDEAERALDQARSEHEAASREHEGAVAETHTAREAVERLRADLESAEEHVREAARSERSARHHAERTEDALEKAERARERAATRLQEASE
jgi:hypothetical protein